MRKKTLALFFEYFNSDSLGKDPFLVPYYLGKALGYNVRIYYPLRDNNKDLPPEYKGVKFMPYSINNETDVYRKMYKLIWKNAKEIDLLMRFFDIHASRNAAFIYKLRNPNGKMYIKMDVNPYNIKSNQCLSPLKKIKRRIYDCLKSFVDIISCETILAYDKLNENTNSSLYWGNKLVLMPNGFDEGLFNSLDIKIREYEEKENIMITVGRLGTPPKNTPMLLKALERVNMNGWKFYLIGPIDNSIKQEIQNFYDNNPNKKESVVFTGAIYDKKELWEYFNRAKVFVLTSRYEGFALVYTEAKRFKNYIISTKVGAATDVIQDNRYGDYIEQDDIYSLAQKLNDIIEGKTNIDVYGGFDTNQLSWEERVKIIIKKLNL